MGDKSIKAGLSLMRRLPPSSIEQNLTGLLNLIPEETDELLQRIDQPLEENLDDSCSRKFLCCDYNRDGDSYRSPWSNEYSPALDDGFLPSDSLREIEIEANELFDAYRELYFEGGISSVYLWDLDDGFAGCFLIKKPIHDNQNNTYVNEGCWESIHVVEAITSSNSNMATYKLTTTIMLRMAVKNDVVGKTDLSGSLTRQQELKAEYGKNKAHIENIGRMIEDMESDMRSNMNELYLMKTRQIMNNIRNGSDGPIVTAAHVAALTDKISRKGNLSGKEAVVEINT